MTLLRRVLAGSVALLAFGASAVPVFGAGNGSVNAQVTAAAAAAPCITVPSATVDFGTQPFNAAGNTNAAQAASIMVTSCGTAGQNLLARGTDATGTGASWTLTTAAMCPATPVLDQYNLGLSPGGSLATTDSVVRLMMGPGEPVTFSPTITMPCAGSSGAGQTMSMSYVFTAILG